MKAAFITQFPRLIDKVYNEKSKEKLNEMFDFYPDVCTRENIAEFSNVEVLFSTWGLYDMQVTEEDIRKYMPKLKILFYGAGSVQSFGRPFLNLGIPIMSSWMANSVPVMEYTVAQIILANKGFYQSARRTKSPESRKEASKYHLAFPGNYETPVGLIGLGGIGSGVAEMLKNYNIKVCAYDPFASEEKLKALNVTPMSLEELFSTCQTISNHTPNLPETVGMLNYSHFSLMKDNATFINTGRGAQVVEEDLLRALNEKPDRTAVLDVTFPEPPEEGSPIYTMDNIYITPHIAGSSGKECRRMGEYAVEEAERYLKGEPLKYLVSLKMLETMA